jgi:hypothetical protein
MSSNDTKQPQHEDEHRSGQFDQDKGTPRSQQEEDAEETKRIKQQKQQG